MSPEQTSRKDAKPTPKQVYYIARLALRYAGHELPATRQDASDLIQVLKQAEEQRSGDDDCPF